MTTKTNIVAMFTQKVTSQNERPDGWKTVVIGYKVEPMRNGDGGLVRNEDGSIPFGVTLYQSGKDDDVYRQFFGSILTSKGEISTVTRFGHHLETMLNETGRSLADSDVDGTPDEVMADAATQTFGGLEIRQTRVKEGYVPYEGFQGEWKNYPVITEFIGPVEDDARLKALRTKAKALHNQFKLQDNEK